MLLTSEKSRLKGFTLAEILATLVVGAMVLVAVIGIYNRARASANRTMEVIDNFLYPGEVLQKISEDIEKVLKRQDQLTYLRVSNGFDRSYPTARLEIGRSILDNENKKQDYENVVWQAAYNFDSRKAGLVLYRSHLGMFFEDRLLGQTKEEWEKGLYIPVCEGVTFFEITAIDEGEELTTWEEDGLPTALRIKLSFAQPEETITGSMEVFEEDIYQRTILIDKDREYKFEIQDVNKPDEMIEDQEEQEQEESESDEPGQQEQTDTSGDEAESDQRTENRREGPGSSKKGDEERRTR